MGCREQFLAWSSWRERRAAREKVRFKALFRMPRCASFLQRPPRSSGCSAHRVCSNSWAFLLRKQVESMTQWVETLASGRAPSLPLTTGQLFFGQVINRFSCILRVDAASKLANQVEQLSTGREGLTKLHSMVPLHDKKKIDFVSLQPFAMHSWLIKQVTTEVLGNVAESPLLQVESSCSSRSGDPRNIERKIPTSIATGAVSMTSSMKERVSVRGFTGIRGNPTFSWGVELVASIIFSMLDCSVWQYFGYSLDWLLACFLHDWRLHRCLATWLTDIWYRLHF